ncbi:MAG: hypothetical protein AB7F28_03000 [Candidatus Margulisiibacteriota bacterium]
MINKAALQEAIKQGDYGSFLKSYLRTAVNHPEIPLPQGRDLATVSDEWIGLIEPLYPAFDAVFMDQLSKLWLSIFKRLDQEKVDTTVDNMLAALEHRPLKKADANPQKVASKSTPLPATSTLHDQDFKLDISASYYEDKALRDAPMLEDELRQRALMMAVGAEQVESFLIQYLAPARQGVMPVCPKVSEREAVEKSWRRLLDDQHLPFSDRFLQELAKQWFFLVNVKGVPLKLDQMEGLYFDLLKTQKKEASSELETTVSTKKSFWKRFF